MKFTDYGKYGLFLSEKVDGKMLITDYWKVVVLGFSVMGNYGLFPPKKLMKRWYLLGLFELSLTFQGLGYMVFYAVSKPFKTDILFLKRVC